MISSSNKPIDKRQKIAIATLIALLSIGGVVFFVLRPTLAEIKNKRTTLLNLKIEEINNQEKSRNIDILNSKLATIEPQIKELDKIFVDKEGGLEFIVAMENIAKLHDIEQHLDLKPIDTVSADKFKKTPLEINASGEYKNVIAYLEAIESMDYHLNIEEITFSSFPLPGENRSETQIRIIAFSYWE
jgi:Tfp pilus assembly protein PilO